MPGGRFDRGAGRGALRRPHRAASTTPAASAARSSARAATCSRASTSAELVTPVAAGGAELRPAVAGDHRRLHAPANSPERPPPGSSPAGTARRAIPAGAPGWRPGPWGPGWGPGCARLGLARAPAYPVSRLPRRSSSPRHSFLSAAPIWRVRWTPRRFRARIRARVGPGEGGKAMAISVNEASAVLRAAVRDTIRKRALLFLAQGAVMVLAGVLALIFPAFAEHRPPRAARLAADPQRHRPDRLAVGRDAGALFLARSSSPWRWRSSWATC